MSSLKKELEGLKLREDWSFNTPAPPGPMPSIPYDALEVTWFNESTTPTKANLHKALRIANRTVPRYLFRVWTAESGGDSRLNDVNAITPLAFLNNPAGPQNIFTMKTVDLYELIGGHLEGDPVDTVFSSWTHSLPFALSIIPGAGTAVHVSVIDTHQLRPENYIFHCGARALGGINLPVYGEEFLVFGVVEGRAHRVVPHKEIVKSISGRLAVDAEQVSWMGAYAYAQPQFRAKTEAEKKKESNERIKHAKAFGKRFGPDFELPMAISLLAVQSDISTDSGLHDTMIRDLSVPAAWTTDTAFPNLRKDDIGFTEEAVVASRTMTAVVKKLRAAGRIPKRTRKSGKKAEKQTEPEQEEEADQQVEDDHEIEEQPEEAEQEERSLAGGKKRHLKKSSRMRRDVYQLYIDMVGFDEHNETVKH